jgi:hypothetical protein
LVTGNNRDRFATSSFFTSLTNIGFSFGPSGTLVLFSSLYQLPDEYLGTSQSRARPTKDDLTLQYPNGYTAIPRSLTMLDASQTHNFVPSRCCTWILRSSANPSHHIVVLLYSCTSVLFTTIHVIVSAITPALFPTTVMPIVAPPIPSSIALQRNIAIAALS